MPIETTYDGMHWCNECRWNDFEQYDEHYVFEEHGGPVECVRRRFKNALLELTDTAIYLTEQGWKFNLLRNRWERYCPYCKDKSLETMTEVFPTTNPICHNECCIPF